jgi:hypothetical protein
MLYGICIWIIRQHKMHIDRTLIIAALASFLLSASFLVLDLHRLIVDLDVTPDGRMGVYKPKEYGTAFAVQVGLHVTCVCFSVMFFFLYFH